MRPEQPDYDRDIARVSSDEYLNAPNADGAVYEPAGSARFDRSHRRAHLRYWWIAHVLSRKRAKVPKTNNGRSAMLGAIIGDIVGSIYEFDNIKTKNFAISIGGDSDTIGAIAGGVAEALFSIGDTILEQAMIKLDASHRQLVDSLYRIIA
jgi:hypothetical protein